MYFYRGFIFTDKETARSYFDKYSADYNDEIAFYEWLVDEKGYDEYEEINNIPDEKLIALRKEFDDSCFEEWIAGEREIDDDCLFVQKAQLWG